MFDIHAAAFCKYNINKSFAFRKPAIDLRSLFMVCMWSIFNCAHIKGT